MRFRQFARLFNVVLVLVLLVGSMSVAWAAIATTIQDSSDLTVNTTSDEPDARPGDGLCQTADRSCSLRAAIEEANAYPGTDNIVFNIPGTGPHTILPKSPLPMITEAVIIDGRTQPDYTKEPVIVLDAIPFK